MQITFPPFKLSRFGLNFAYYLAHEGCQRSLFLIRDQVDLDVWIYRL
jgi:hypothetical protein